MKKILIVGAGRGGTALIKILKEIPTMHILAVVDPSEKAPGLALAKKLHIQTGSSWKEWLNQDIDIIIEATGKETVLEEIIALRKDSTVVVPGSVAYIISELVLEKDALLEQVKLHRDNMLEAIIKSSNDAISVVDEDGNGLIINPAYTRLTGLTESDVLGKPATVDIYEGDSIHLKVLETGKAYRGIRMKVGQHKKDVIVNVAPIHVNGKIRGSVGVIHDVSEIQTLTKELQRAKQIIRNLDSTYTFHDIIGTSPEIKLALEQARVGANAPATVLLRGESGTGKELFAHAIHNESARKGEKFIRINCATLNEEMLGIELFGYESRNKVPVRVGAFEEAKNGSVFLDEIGELSLEMQDKLLRLLEEKVMYRVNGKELIPVDVRIITATNMNLEKAMHHRTFREDLYYHLNRFPIFIPSLRERISDLEELVSHFIKKLNREYGRNVTSIDKEAIRLLKTYDWPGNIRELENIIGRAMIYMDYQEETITEEHLPKIEQLDNFSEQSTFAYAKGETLPKAVENFEKEYIFNVYKNNHYNKTKTAQALDISIRNLYYKIEKYGLDLKRDYREI